MAIPFRNLLKRSSKAKEPSAPAPLPRVEKSRSERLSKTVMPNARTVSPRDPFKKAPPALASVPAPRVVADPAVEGPRMVSYTPTSNNQQTTVLGDLPPAVALALQPEIERVISLELADIIAQIPPEYLKPLASVDGSRRVLLKASELEKGMSAGKPIVSLSSIHQQVPEIFLRPLLPWDAVPISLPFPKVLEGFQRMQVRRDQLRDSTIPQVPTPFLKATLEDNDAFGLPCAPIEVSELPSMRLEPASAQSIADAEPEASIAEKLIPTLDAPPGMPLAQLADGATENGEPASPLKRDQPAPIPFHLSPNGTGAPASESVPASSGPPVPTSLLPQTPPKRIPFKMAEPPDALSEEGRPRFELESTAAADPLTESGGSEKENQPGKIRIGLKTILQMLPPFQLHGDIKNVPAEMGIEFPFPLIEPQLAAGRVVVSPALFEEALPQEYRHLFNASDPNTPVLLPLEEVLKNLPGSSLRIREDQVEQDAAADFRTPFSVKAEEDAERLRVDSAPVVKQATRTASEKRDAKTVILQAIQLTGVSGCAVTFADGLSLAGNLPEDVGAEGLCAMAPSLFQRLEDYVVNTKLGALEAITLHCEKSPITFFTQGNICLAALHPIGGLTRPIHEQLARMAQELSRTYSQPEVSDVHH